MEHYISANWANTERSLRTLEQEIKGGANELEALYHDKLKLIWQTLLLDFRDKTGCKTLQTLEGIISYTS